MYVITDYYGAVLWQSERFTLRYARRLAQRLANDRDDTVILTNDVTNRLLSIHKPSRKAL